MQHSIGVSVDKTNATKSASPPVPAFPEDAYIYKPLNKVRATRARYLRDTYIVKTKILFLIIGIVVGFVLAEIFFHM